MADGISAAPPETDGLAWFREDKVRYAITTALNEAVEQHGNKAKSIAWDVRASFNRILSNG